jgi:hypothetical protein
MFSLFTGGITNCIPVKQIDLHELIRSIKSSQNKSLIEQIRLLASQGDVSYKKLKEKLDYITPNALLKTRLLSNEDHFQDNFISFSSYIYFDIDNVSNPIEYKSYLINQYSSIASLICVSPSGKGVSILVRITNEVTSITEYEVIWDKIRNTILKDENVDLRCKGLGKAMFLSHDPNLFYSYDNSITVDVKSHELSESYEKSTKQCISFNSYKSNTLIYTFSDLPDYDEFIDKIVTSTIIDVKNPIVDFNTIDYVKSTFPRVIKDNHKHKVFSVLIHKLVYLNPNLDVKYLFAYVNFINNNYTTARMEFKELCRYFSFIYGLTQVDGYVFNRKRTKSFHVNQSAGLDKIDKSRIINSLNGRKRVNLTIERIKSAREYLEANGIKSTQKAIAEISGLSLGTVKNHYKSEQSDILQIVKSINDSFYRNKQ